MISVDSASEDQLRIAMKAEVAGVSLSWFMNQIKRQKASDHSRN